MKPSVRLAGTIERKRPTLPRYVELPTAAIAAWSLDGTTEVCVSINGTPVAGRTVKRWDARRWFIEITQKDCDRLGVDTGDTVDLELTLAVSMPAELASLLETAAVARRRWESLTPAQRRMLRMNVASAARSSTRARRAAAALIGAPPTEE